VGLPDLAEADPWKPRLRKPMTSLCRIVHSQQGGI
jgi:hypothetical protein